MRIQIFILLLLLAIGFPASAQEARPAAVPYIKQNPLNQGEAIEYKVTFGFFTVGRAEIMTSPHLYKVNGRPCYKIDIRGRTSGAVDWVAKVDDVWGTYMDTLTFLPQTGYRTIKENNYRKNEVTRFDQQTKKVELKVLNQKTGEFKEPKIFDVVEPVRDLVSGYSYLRTLDYDRYRKGDTIRLYGLFEDELYDFKILYAGKEVLKTKVGKMKAYKLVPVMPNNSLFSGENAITLWLSADSNKIPLKVEASMVIGKAGCEIIGFSSLKKEPEYQ